MSAASPFPGDIGSAGWSTWLAEAIDTATLERLRSNTATGRPCGKEDFVVRLERELDRLLRPQKTGRKPKAQDEPDVTTDLFGNL